MKQEESIQASLITWWQYAHKGFGLPDARVLFMVPNGSYLGAGVKILASGKAIPLSAMRFHKLRRMGFVNGVPDILLIVARGGRSGLALELKSPTGRTSNEQREMLELFKMANWAQCIAWSLDEAIGAITRYLKSGNPLLA